jgi:hypothetical protein
MVAIAQDVAGADRVRPVVQERAVSFPVLVDRTSELGRQLGFRIVPSGAFVDPDATVVLRHVDDFDIADPRVRVNLDAFLEGRELRPPEGEDKMDPQALELFAQGVALFSRGSTGPALTLWRRALEIDPDNFVIRSQIWAVEHPEHFYPAVDREWQRLQLLKEGYDKPLP